MVYRVISHYVIVYSDLLLAFYVKRWTPPDPGTCRSAPGSRGGRGGHARPGGQPGGPRRTALPGRSPRGPYNII